MGTPLHVLIIDDSEDDALLIGRQLRQWGYELDCARADSVASLTAALERRHWDLVLSDYTMPGFSGTRALALVRERDPDIPYIFVSGTIGEEAAVEAMRSGAQDYVMKGDFSRLLPVIERELREALTRRERRRAEERLAYLAHHDALTGLPNRVLFVDRLEQALHDAHRRGRIVGVAFVDLDRFKIVNDSLGHAAGDDVLKQVGVRLSALVRAGDTVARLSGDEFTLVLADMASAEDAARLGQKILDGFGAPFLLAGREFYFTTSVGIALYPADGADAEALLRNADMAMYRAKEAGRNSYHFYAAEMTTRAASNLALQNALRQALQFDELLLHYQPVIELASGRVISAEALLRWQHPEQGLVLPDAFVPLAEETGQIAPVGNWVLEKACARCRAWELAGLAPMRIAVNLSARQFVEKNLAVSILRALEEAGLAPERLELEITESVFMQDTENTHAVLRGLRDAGIHLTLDDFGTGYSSLSYLKRFPVDHLKIDRSFVRDIPGNADDTAIVMAIIAMAHRLHIHTIAEGVETREQLQFLREEGCDFVQGYYYSRPLAEERFLRFLATCGGRPPGST